MQVGDLVKHKFRKKGYNIGLIVDIENDDYTEDGKRYVIAWNNSGIFSRTLTTGTLIFKLQKL